MSSREHDSVGTESGLYRIFTGRFFSIAVLALWGLLSIISGIIWNDVQAGKIAINTLQAQRISDVEERESFKRRIMDDMIELKADVKEILRESRK